MKDSGVQWLEMIPKDWDLIPFKAIFKTRKGLNITKENLSENGIPVISYGQIHARFNTGTSVSEKLFRYVSEEYLASNPECLASKYDSFFADTSEDLEGAGNVAFIDTDDKIFAGYHTIIASPKKSAQSKYFAYLFKTDAWRIQLRSTIYGVKVFSITQRILNGTDILVPSIEEQSKIASFLDEKCSEIDSLISLQDDMIARLQEYKQSVITEAVTRGLDPDVPMKDSGIEWIGSIPEQWSTCRIKDLFELRKEKSFLPLSEVNLISLYTDKGVVQHNDLTSTTGNKASNADGYKIVMQNDIVVNIILCWMGAIGRSAYNGVTSPAYDVYVPKKGVESRFYHHFFRTKGFNGECYKQGRGIMAMRWRTYSEQFREILVVQPPLEEQLEIIEFLDRKCTEIDTLIDIKKQKIEVLKEYKKSLIYECVTGKREVA